MSNTGDYYSQFLDDIIQSQAGEQGLAWLATAKEKISVSSDTANDLAIFSAMARRKVGAEVLSSVEPLKLQDSDEEIDLSAWNVSDLARVLLVLHACRCHPHDALDLVKSTYHLGDEAERAAIIKAMALFPSAVELLPLASEVGRTNSLILLSALALNNPYPCLFFSEAQFNQLVLKCLFTKLGIADMYGLQKRANADLSLSCEYYTQERLNADRDVPRDIWLALAPCANEQGKAFIADFLADEDPLHRYYCAIAIGNNPVSLGDFRLALKEQLKAETDKRVLQTLQSVLSK